MLVHTGEKGSSYRLCVISKSSDPERERDPQPTPVILVGGDSASPPT